MTRQFRITCFIVLNLLTMAWSNRPEDFTSRVWTAFHTTLSPQSVRCLDCGTWLIERYGHLSGTGRRWMLFAALPRYEFRYAVEVTRADGTMQEGPRPQSEWRWFAALFDHKETKVELTLLTDVAARAAYARYLCRRLAAAGDPAAAIQLVSYRRDIPPRADALAGADKGDEVRQTTERIPCIAEPPPLVSEATS